MFRTHPRRMLVSLLIVATTLVSVLALNASRAAPRLGMGVRGRGSRGGFLAHGVFLSTWSLPPVQQRCLRDVTQAFRSALQDSKTGSLVLSVAMVHWAEVRGQASSCPLIGPSRRQGYGAATQGWVIAAAPTVRAPPARVRSMTMAGCSHSSRRSAPTRVNQRLNGMVSFARSR
jgi:hypothetical protein